MEKKKTINMDLLKKYNTLEYKTQGNYKQIFDQSIATPYDSCQPPLSFSIFSPLDIFLELNLLIEGNPDRSTDVESRQTRNRISTSLRTQSLELARTDLKPELVHWTAALPSATCLHINRPGEHMHMCFCAATRGTTCCQWRNVMTF